MLALWMYQWPWPAQPSKLMSMASIVAYPAVGLQASTYAQMTAGLSAYAEVVLESEVVEI